MIRVLFEAGAVSTNLPPLPTPEIVVRSGAGIDIDGHLDAAGKTELGGGFAEGGGDAAGGGAANDDLMTMTALETRQRGGTGLGHYNGHGEQRGEAGM